jgi:hypothetical protein
MMTAPAENLGQEQDLDTSERLDKNLCATDDQELD